MEKEKSLHIVNFEIENIKRVKVARIKPDGKMVVIEGKNEQGKTSILDSIVYLLAGKKLMPDNPIRNGETTASIVAEIGDYTISRIWTSAETSTLKIVSKDGMTPGKPQDFLNNLVGHLTFDPLAFVLKDKAKRIEILKEITGCDFTIEDADIKKATADRKDINRDIDKSKKELENYKDLKVVELRERSAVQKDIDDINSDNQLITNAINEIDDRKNDQFTNLDKIKQLQKNISDNQQEIEDAKQSIIDFKEGIAKSLKDIETEEFSNKVCQQTIDENEPLASKEQKKTFVLDDEMKDLDDNQDVKFKLQRKKELENSLESEILDQRKYQKIIDDNKEAKATKLKAADMPIDGLSLGEDDVLYNGNQFSEISSARKIEISMAIAIKENPKLKVCRIEDGSLLDKESWDKVAAMAEANDFQVWIERIANNPSGNAIFIEDGEIKEAK